MCVCFRSFNTLMEEQTFKHFRMPIAEVLGNPPRRLIYAHFMDQRAATYQEVQDDEKMKQVVQKYLDDYNNLLNNKMNLVSIRAAIGRTASSTLPCVRSCHHLPLQK